MTETVLQVKRGVGDVVLQESVGSASFVQLGTGFQLQWGCATLQGPLN